MFTQEQLDGIKGVMIEVVKPLEEKMTKRFDGIDLKLSQMDEKLDGHEEQIAEVSVQVTALDKKVDNMETSLITRMDDGFDKMDVKMHHIDKSRKKAAMFARD